MPSIMPPPCRAESQKQIMDRVSGTLDQAAGKRRFHVSQGLTQKLTRSIEYGRAHWVANENTYEAQSIRNPPVIMTNPPGGVSPCIWPPLPKVPESAHTKVIGDSMESVAGTTDKLFSQTLTALKKALKPSRRSGKVILTTGERKALGKAVAAYQAALATMKNDKAQFQTLRGLDKQEPATTVEVNEADFINGFARIEVPVGEGFSVNLSANPSTGYEWRAYSDRTLGHPEKSFEPDGPGAGSGGTTKLTWESCPLHRPGGQHQVTLVYARPWENQSEQKYQLDVTFVPKQPMPLD